MDFFSYLEDTEQIQKGKGSQMEKHKLLKTAYLAVLWIVLLAAVLAGATYAWFSFSPATNVTPMGGTISEGDVYLLISNSESGEFDTQCTLVLDETAEVMSPISTADMQSFYAAAAQNRKGISILYKDVTEKAGTMAMHGKVYLKSEGADCDVYFFRSGLGFGDDSQAMAAMRLGMRITTVNETKELIFSLEELGGFGGKSLQTVPENGTVVASVDGNGRVSYTSDPAVSIGPYLATDEGPEDEEPGPGETPLCTLEAEEIATVEYWLYLEGCDEHCITEVQSREIDLQLAFAGVELEE